MKIAKTTPNAPSLAELAAANRAWKTSAAERTSGAVGTAARTKTRAILDYARNCRFTSWADLASRFSVTVPETFSARPITYLEVTNFCAWFEKDFENALLNAATATPHSKTRIHFPPGDEITIGAFTLRPRQRKARWQFLHEVVENQTTNAALCTMNTGSGKTQVAAAVIRAFQENSYFGLGNKFKLWNIVYVMPRAVLIKTARALAKAGVTGIGSDVQLIPYTSFRTKSYKNLFEEVTVKNQFNGQEQNVFKFKLGRPALVILDECHKIKKRDSTMTRYVRAFLDPATKFLLMSATPALVPNDLEFFAHASRKEYAGAPLDELTFPVLCSTVARIPREGVKTNNGQGNDAGMKRLFDWFDTAIINPPADPRRAKAHNGVKLIYFVDEKSKQRYNNAQEIYLETSEKFGKTPEGAGEVLTAFTNFRRAAEAESVKQVVDLALQSHAAGRAPVMAVCFRQTVKLLVAELARRGIKRSNLSIIQGGESEIREDEILTMFEWVRLRQKTLEPGFEWTDPKLRAKFNKSERYHQTRLRSERSVDEQRELDAWLKDMRLYNQTPEQRQDEIDNFQEGRTEFCIFTLAAGGTGIDLDQQVPNVRPREMFSQLCYYAEEFVQAFGRCYREFTLTDVNQWAIAFRGTIITEHVIPRLVGKLSTINKSAGAGLNLEAALTAAAASGKIERGEVVEPAVEVTDEVLTEEEEDDEEEDNGKE